MNRVNHFINSWRRKNAKSLKNLFNRRSSFFETFLRLLITIQGRTEDITSFWSGLHSGKSDHSFHNLICLFVHRELGSKKPYSWNRGVFQFFLCHSLNYTVWIITIWLIHCTLVLIFLNFLVSFFREFNLICDKEKFSLYCWDWFFPLLPLCGRPKHQDIMSKLKTLRWSIGHRQQRFAYDSYEVYSAL